MLSSARPSAATIFFDEFAEEITQPDKDQALRICLVGEQWKEDDRWAICEKWIPGSCVDQLRLLCQWIA
jgi:hypothetical protein